MTNDPAPNHTTAGVAPADAPLTYFQRGILARALGEPCITVWLDDDEAEQFRKGYEHD